MMDADHLDGMEAAGISPADGCLLCGGQGHDHLQCPGTIDPNETKRIVRDARPALEQRPMGLDGDGE